MREEAKKTTRRLLGVTDGMFIVLIVLLFSQVYRYVKTYQIVHYKYVQLYISYTSSEGNGSMWIVPFRDHCSMVLQKSVGVPLTRTKRSQ